MKSEKVRNHLLVLAALIGACVLTAQGCEPSAPSDCDKWCACYTCSEAYREACEQRFQRDRQTAAERGCSAEHEEALWCVDEASCGELFYPDALAAPNAYKCKKEWNSYLACL